MRGKMGLLVSFAGYTAVFFVLSRACIYGQIFPFAFSMMFALAWANQKPYIILPAYSIGFVLNNLSWQGTVQMLCTVALLAIPYYIHYALKKPMNKWEIFLFCALSQSAYVAFSVVGHISPVIIVATILLGLCFLYFAIEIFEPLILKGRRYSLAVFEKVSAGIVLMAISDGLVSCDIYGFSVLKLAVALLLLVISYSSSMAKSNIFAIIIALGTLLRAGNPVYVAPIILWAVCLDMFRVKNKFLPALAIIAGEILCVYYFKLYYSTYFLEFIPVIVASFIFIVLPKSVFQGVEVLMGENGDRLAVKNVVNRNREILHKRLGRLSEVFNEMNHVFKGLIKRTSSEEEVKTMLFEELKSGVCKGCPEAKHCHRTFSEDSEKIFKDLLTIAFERGKVTILDFPSYLSSRCGRVNNLIGQINTLTAQYKSYSLLVGNVDTSKLLISDQLEGMAGIMRDLASEVETEISFDSKREDRLIEELSASNIICTDALIYEKDSRYSMASLVVREEDVNKLKLQEVTSKICGGKMAIFESCPSPRLGLVNVLMKTSPKFDCIFGLASSPKTGNTTSGDCHCIERLDGDKFIFAICDGMGNGDKAGQKSERAISLVENFYKAGFDNEIILSSVNKLLNLEKDDIFSTIDICVVDLTNGIADFVKMGSSSSFIRGKEDCKIIESGALPVGVLPDVSPLTKKVVLSDKQFVVMASDGVVDTFGSDEDMRDFLYTIKTANPQEYADEILSKAIANNNGYAVDDMTVIVVKIF